MRFIRLIAAIIDYMALQIIAVMLLIFINIIVPNNVDLYHIEYLSIIEVQISFIINIRLTFGGIICTMVGMCAMYFYIRKYDNQTLGEKILNIKIYSTKYSVGKFALLRTIFREISIYMLSCSPFIFVISIAVIMIINNDTNIAWYDKLIGLKYEIQNNDIIN